MTPKTNALLEAKTRLCKNINIKDKELIKNLIQYSTLHSNETLFLSFQIDRSSHLDFLKKIKSKYKKNELGGEDILQKNHEDISNEWQRLLKSAIVFLRKNDKREPFKDDSTGIKKPKAYGVDNLFKFYKKFVEFEDILYGADKWYRDHVVHAYRVWLLGMHILTTKIDTNKYIVDEVAKHFGSENSKSRINKITREGKDFTYSTIEIFCAWTITALTHDLGYPLEKAPNIIATIHNMMTNFVASPDVKHDFGFNSAADKVNEYIVKLISTKMVLDKHNASHNRHLKRKTQHDRRYKGRIQPKYYIKFLKSLEMNKHGIISSIVLYKSLVFFLESECNICEDYFFKIEDARQFYIRREILRAIATHTCDDVYLMFVADLSFILFISDEIQDWGRNKYSGIKKDDIYIYPPTINTFNLLHINVTQNYLILKEDKDYHNMEHSSLVSILNRIKKEFGKFVKVYRDGIDTEHRKFSFEKSIKITYTDVEDLNINIIYRIAAGSESKIEHTTTGNKPNSLKHKAYLKELAKLGNHQIA